MNTKKVIQQIVDIGIPINVIARKVNKDGSTISKWLKGQTNISSTLEINLQHVAIQLNNEWQHIFNDIIQHSVDNEGG